MSDSQAAAPAAHGNLQRGLKNRHIQLIAIGGAIGTGLFMGSGKTIATAGPAILFVYMVLGLGVFMFMRAMGELLLSKTHYGTFADLARDILGDWAGFVVGWTYWTCWVVTGVADMVAIVGYVRFWWADIPAWIPILVVMCTLLLLNLTAVDAFGETEFWFSMIKITAIVALILVALYLTITGATNSEGTKAAFSNLWNHGGLFPQGFGGFIAGFPLAVFAFVGVELAGTTVAETKNPEKSLPKAINSIPVRIALFYVLALAAIMFITPWTEIDPNQSPFVTTFAIAGLGIAATVINIVVITSAASSANSGIYSTSRMIYGLSQRGDAPKVLGILSKRHVPKNALFLSCVLVLSSIAVVAGGDSISDAFNMVASMCTTLFIAVWSFIMAAYIKYIYVYPERHAESSYKLPGGKFGAWFVVAFLAAIFVILASQSDSRIGLIAAASWVVLLTIIAFYRQRRAAA